MGAELTSVGIRNSQVRMGTVWADVNMCRGQSREGLGEVEVSFLVLAGMLDGIGIATNNACEEHLTSLCLCSLYFANF